MSAIVSYAPWLAWAFLPALATKYTLQAAYYSGFVSRPATQQTATQHVARTRLILIGSFLLYQFVSGLSEREPTAYRLLNVDLDANSDTVKKGFRRLAMMYHPDKVGPQGERFFIALRRSHDVLSDPVKRFAYDRFGLKVLDWKDALTYREHMVIGLREAIAFYIVNPAIFIFISWLHGDKTFWSFWHLSCLVTMASLELSLVTAPVRPLWMQRILPRHTVHEVVLLLHQMYTSSTMAARQLLPYMPTFDEGDGSAGKPKTLEEAQQFIVQMAREMEFLNGLAMQMQRNGDQALLNCIEPLRATKREGPATLPEAAERAASSAAGKDSTAPTQRSQPEEAWIERVSEALIAKALRENEAVMKAVQQDLEKKQPTSSSAPSSQSAPVSAGVTSREGEAASSDGALAAEKKAEQPESSTQSEPSSLPQKHSSGGSEG